MTAGTLIEEQLTRSIIGAFYSVYRALGYGFLEHVYILALERELRARGHEVAREVSVDVMYNGEELCTQRLDMIVDGQDRRRNQVHVRAAPGGPAATLQLPPHYEA